jgi:hypothetical protein
MEGRDSGQALEAHRRKGDSGNGTGPDPELTPLARMV